MAVDNDSIEEFIELAGPRRVLTQEGAAYYGQPIGSVITADLIAAAEAENNKKGVSQPKGMLAPAETSESTSSSKAPDKPAEAVHPAAPATTKPKGNPSAGNAHTQTGYPAPLIDSTPITPDPSAASAVEDEPSLVIGVAPSTLSGPESFSVGASTYSAPTDSRLIQPKSGEAMAIVVTPDKEIHFFTEAGEVEAADAVKSAFSERFGNKVSSDDSLYSEGSFTKTNGLDTVQVGQHLYDPDGNKIFTKQEAGFVHSDLGVPVSDKDIKELFDSGELSSTPSAAAEEDQAPQEVAFATMSPEEFSSYVEKQESGAKLYLPVAPEGKSKSAPAEFAVLTKKEGSSWLREDTGASVSSKSLTYIRGSLRTLKPEQLVPVGTIEEESKDEKVAKLAGAAALDAAEVPVSETLHVGDEIDQTITLDMLYEAAAPGTRVSHFPEGMSSTPDFSMTLLESGEWESDRDYVLGGFELPESPFAGSYWVSEIPGQPAVTVQDEPTVEAPEVEVTETSEDESDPLLDQLTKLLASSIVFNGENATEWTASAVEVWEAIGALQSHSHGSPVYGLKSLPSDNAVRSNQEDLISEAEAEFPGKAPKAAVLAFLHSKVDTPYDVDHPEPATLVHLGAESPKRNSFGVTGGDFSQSDIEQAVEIISGYDGKLYKSQLTAVDNPLSTLDFNSLVSPNKDKLQQKADVVAYLRGLLP